MMENSNSSCVQTVYIAIITAIITGFSSYYTALTSSEYEYKKTIDKLQLALNATNAKNLELRKYELEDEKNKSFSIIKNGILQIQLLANGFNVTEKNATKMQQAGEIFSRTSAEMSKANIPLNICNEFSNYQVSFNHLISSIDKYNEAQYFNNQVEAKKQFKEYAFNYREVGKLSTMLLYQINEYERRQK